MKLFNLAVVFAVIPAAIAVTFPCNVPTSWNRDVAVTIRNVGRQRGVSDKVMLAMFDAAVVESKYVPCKLQISLFLLLG